MGSSAASFNPIVWSEQLQLFSGLELKLKMEDTDIRSAKSAEMRAQFATVENYMVVGCMMTVSALIGIFFWRKQRKQQSAEELLVGGRRCPCCLSLFHLLPVSCLPLLFWGCQQRSTLKALSSSQRWLLRQSQLSQSPQSSSPSSTTFKYPRATITWRSDLVQWFGLWSPHFLHFLWHSSPLLFSTSQLLH